MKLERGELIGTNNWNPLGESLIGIVSRVSTLNYFSWRDVKTVFFSDIKKGAVPHYTLDAHTSRGINLQALIDLFEDRKDIGKSFPSHYIDEQRWGKCENITEENIRICPDCAKLGKHLTIHQLKLFDLCPIHSSSLLSTCIKCGFKFGQFALERMNKGVDTLNSFRCKQCGHTSINFSKISLRAEKGFKNKLKQFLTDYELWIRNSSIRYSPQSLFDGTEKLIHEHLVKKCEPPTVKQYFQSFDHGFYGKAAYTKKTHDELIIPQKISCPPNESIELRALTLTLSVYATDFLRVFRKRFAISDKQLSSAKLVQQFSDIFWGLNYSVWACAYEEVESAVLLSYRDLVQETDNLFTQNWLMGCWYRYFACVLIDYLDLSRKEHIFLLFRISKNWIRKFLTDQFINEVGRICKKLITLSEQEPYLKLTDRFNFASSYDGVKVCCRETEALMEILFWQRGPSINEATDLYKSGFRGYTNDMRTNYENYKVLHRVFDIDEKLHNYKEYVAMISMRSIVNIEL